MNLLNDAYNRLTQFVNENPRMVTVATILAALLVVVFLSMQTPDPEPFAVRYGRGQRGGDVVDKQLVLFYAPWCGHCKSLKPTWDQLAQKYHNRVVGSEKVAIMKVNADEHPEKTQELDISGFPTIILFKGNDKIMYSGDRSLKSLETFLRRASLPLNP